MELFLYRDLESGVDSVAELLSSYDPTSKNFIHIRAKLKHVKENGFLCDYVRSLEGGKCFDGKDVQEIKITIASERMLLRLFFVLFDKKIVLYDWLKKRHNPDWGKKEQNKVDKSYRQKIENAKEYYKKSIKNKHLLSKIKL